jgi:hypothetical protein
MKHALLLIDFHVRRLISKRTDKHHVYTEERTCDGCGRQHLTCGFFGDGWVCEYCVMEITGKYPLKEVK